ncbi:MAG: ATP-dependent helicase [Patescibacteria group bacterium]
MKPIDFKKELNAEQYRAVTAPNGQHLVLAGAGSGKTRTLVYRVAWLISQGVKPEEVLLLTFTNKAANEMLSRVRTILGFKPSQNLPLWGGTFHSVASRLLRKYGHYVDVPNDFTILDEEDRNSLIKNISKNIWGGLGVKSVPSPALIAETLSFSINSQISLEQSLEEKFFEWQPFYSYIEKIVQEYQQRKVAGHLLDFDDLLLGWYRLTLRPDALKLMRQQWGHILVDEYQDTNTLQAEIILKIAAADKNLLVVGDDAQSIYSFRAANIQNILDFPKNFQHCQIYKLENNYRSSPEIIRVANQIIISEQKEFRKTLKAVRQNFVRPELVAVQNNLAEASFVADKIYVLLEAGLEPKEIAILFRAAHHSQALEMELNKRGIAYEMRGGLKFFERAHVKDVVAWLKILYNHRDEVAWLRVLQMYPGIGPRAASLIYQSLSPAEDLIGALKSDLPLGAQAQNSWQQIKSTLDILLKHADKPVGKLINLIIEHYSDYLLEQYADYRQRQDDLEQLAAFAGNYDSLEQFLSEVVLQENYTLVAGEHKRIGIVLSTVHQAKGLEWPAVFIINLTTQAFPHPLAIKEEEQAEERRLFYVAVTRAKDYLYLLYPLATWSYGGQKSLQPSPFIYEIDSNLLNYNRLAVSTLGAAQDGIEYVADPDSNTSRGFLPDVDEW